jgi:hypothetical protein
MKSTTHRGLWIVLALPLACGKQAPEPPRPAPPVNPPGTASQESPRQLRHQLLPQLARGAPLPPEGSGLLRLAPDLGVGVLPVLQGPGQQRVPTAVEIRAFEAEGDSLATLYRQNLGRLVRSASLLSIGDPWEGIRFLYLDTGLPQAESLILLPEIWTEATRALDREIWALVPDRGHCRFVPAGPWRLIVEMASDLQQWYEEGGAPLFDRCLRREGDTLVGGPAFAALRG